MRVISQDAVRLTSSFQNGLSFDDSSIIHYFITVFCRYFIQVCWEKENHLTIFVTESERNRVT